MEKNGGNVTDYIIICFCEHQKSPPIIFKAFLYWKKIFFPHMFFKHWQITRRKKKRKKKNIIIYKKE